MERITEWFLIRHGKTQGNLEKRYIGKTEESLCQKGKEDLCRNLGNGIYPSKQVPFFLFCSPMKRCVETAHFLYPDKAPFLVEEMTEIDFGSWEGKNYKDLSGNPDYQSWIASGGNLPFPNGESRDEFINRNMQAFERIVKEDAQRFIGIVHGGTIMAVLSRLTGEDYFSFACKNGGGVSFLLRLDETCKDYGEILKWKFI